MNMHAAKRPLAFLLCVDVCRPYSHRAHLLVRLAGQGRRVWGLTKPHDKLYVVYLESDAISVYIAYQQAYTRLPDIHINGMKNPVDIAACINSGGLYVSDVGSDCVWRVKADRKVDKWLHVQNVVSLSVTSDGRLVMLIATDLQGKSPNVTWHGRLEVYSPGGVPLTKITLPADILNPRHAVQTASGTFIVSHGNKDTALNRVCEVTSDYGVIVASYGHQPGSEPGQLNTPFRIALDSEERIIVADRINDRVVLLDRKLNLQRVLLTWTSHIDGIGGPMRLHYDRQTAQLAVGLMSGHVDIYSLR
jgi:hypothetical protein